MIQCTKQQAHLKMSKGQKQKFFTKETNGKSSSERNNLSGNQETVNLKNNNIFHSLAKFLKPGLSATSRMEVTGLLYLVSGKLLQLSWRAAWKYLSRVRRYMPQRPSMSHAGSCATETSAPHMLTCPVILPMVPHKPQYPSAGKINKLQNI